MRTTGLTGVKSVLPSVESCRRRDLPVSNLCCPLLSHADDGTYQCQINSKDDQTNSYDVHLHVVSK